MKRKHKRLTFVAVAMVLLAAAVGLMLTAFEENIVFFYSPTDVKEKELPVDRRLRIGGLVEEGSVDKSAGSQIRFRVTDMVNTLPVVYTGLLPDLFREGQGVVAEGLLKDGVLQADEVLAKHDENYMPPEVADTLKKSGHWEEVQQNLEKMGKGTQ